MAIFTLIESDAHNARQSSQQVIDSIMVGIEALLKKLKNPDKDREKPPNQGLSQAEESSVLAPPEMAEPSISIEIIDDSQPTSALAGNEPALLNAALPKQLEGQNLPALLPEVKIQVGETSIQSVYGGELRQALMQFSSAQLEQLHQAVVPAEQENTQEDIIDVEWEAASEVKSHSEPDRDIEIVHTEQLSVDQVERSTGQDYGDSPHLNDVGPVIAQVNSRGHILDTGNVKRQIESRSEDAELEDEIDEQRLDSVKDLSTPCADDLRVKETMDQLLEAVGEAEFVGDRFTLSQEGNLMTLIANDGRGVLLATQGNEILNSRLEPQDYRYLNGTRAKLEEINAMESITPPIKQPALEISPPALAFELE